MLRSALHTYLPSSLVVLGLAACDLPLDESGSAGDDLTSVSGVEHVLEFLIAGANAVQVGTASFRDPGVSGRLIRDLALWCDGHGVARASELTATLKTRPRPEKVYA